MNKLDECIRGYVCPKSKLEGQGESVTDGSETGTDTCTVKKAHETKWDMVEMRKMGV